MDGKSLMDMLVSFLAEAVIEEKVTKKTDEPKEEKVKEEPKEDVKRRDPEILSVPKSCIGCECIESCFGEPGDDDEEFEDDDDEEEDEEDNVEDELIDRPLIKSSKVDSYEYPLEDTLAFMAVKEGFDENPDKYDFGFLVKTGSRKALNQIIRAIVQYVARYHGATKEADIELFEELMFNGMSEAEDLWLNTIESDDDDLLIDESELFE